MSDHNGDLEQSSKMAKMSNPEEEDSGITLVDVLEEEDQLEEDANAVLGGSDDQNCTYSLVLAILMPYDNAISLH